MRDEKCSCLAKEDDTTKWQRVRLLAADHLVSVENSGLKTGWVSGEE